MYQKVKVGFPTSFATLVQIELRKPLTSWKSSKPYRRVEYLEREVEGEMLEQERSNSLTLANSDCLDVMKA